MNNPRGIYLPSQVWKNYQLYADYTNSIPEKHPKNTPSISVLLRRIGTDEKLLNAIGNYLNQPKNQQQFNIESIVIRPLSVKTETIARIIIKDDLLSVIFPEKREDFKVVIKEKLGFHWLNDCWQRQIIPLNGSIADRASETGHQLLAAGFCVMPPNADIQKSAISGNYQPEIKRWIKRFVPADKKTNPFFTLQWRRPDDFYTQAMRMTGAKYHDGIITVPFEHYAEIEDFATLHEFKFSDAATELLNLAKTLRENAITVDVTAKAEQPQDFERPVLTIPDDVAVADELLDD